MAKQGTLRGTYKKDDTDITVSVPVVMFEDEGCHIFYCPALNVYGYGHTDQEAIDSLDVSIREFFSYTMNKRTLTRELESLGWIVKKEKKFTPPLFTSLIEKNNALKNILNTRSVKTTDYGVSMPVIS